MVSRIQGELSGSICPGEVRTKCITGNQDGPCSRNKAVLGYQEDPPRPLSKSLALHTGSCDDPIPVGFFPGRLTESEIADWATGPLMATSRQQNLRVTMLFHSITQYEWGEAPTHQGRESGPFWMLLCWETWLTSRPEGCPQQQVSITLSFPLQTWTNVSTDPESVKAAASASTPRATTPASAHLAWSSAQRTRGIAQVDPQKTVWGRPGAEEGAEGVQRPPRMRETRLRFLWHQGPAGALPKDHLLKWSHHRPGRQQSLLGLGFLCRVPCPPRTSPDLTPSTSATFEQREVSPLAFRGGSSVQG